MTFGFRAGFPKWWQSPPGGDFSKLGAIISKGEKKGGNNFKILKLKLDTFELQIKSKKGLR